MYTCREDKFLTATTINFVKKLMVQLSEKKILFTPMPHWCQENNTCIINDLMFTSLKLHMLHYTTLI